MIGEISLRANFVLIMYIYLFRIAENNNLSFFHLVLNNNNNNEIFNLINFVN